MARTDKNFSSIAIDQAHEQMNLVSSQQVLYKNYELQNKMINLIIIDQIKRMKPKIV